MLEHSPTEVLWESFGGGYYRSRDLLPVHLLVINELEITPKNYPLLMFASSKQRFREFLRDAIQRNASSYVLFAYYIQPRMTEEVVMATRYQIRREEREIFMNAVGRELLSLLSPEERLEGISNEDLIKQLSIQARLRGLSDEELRQLEQLLKLKRE